MSISLVLFLLTVIGAINAITEGLRARRAASWVEQSSQPAVRKFIKEQQTDFEGSAFRYGFTACLTLALLLFEVLR